MELTSKHKIWPSLLCYGSVLLLAGCGGGSSDTPANHAPQFTSPSTITIAENSQAVMTLAASDADNNTLTFSLVGGTDKAAFNIDTATGMLSFVSAPDYETPADSNKDNIYEVQVLVSDATDTSSQTIQITVTNLNEPPLFGSNMNASVAENTRVVTTLAATDAEADALTYKIASGADRDLFTIDGTSNMLSFISAPDYEAPADSNRDNSYELVVVVSDGSHNVPQQITVTVTDVSLEIDSVSPQDESANVAADTTIQATFNNDVYCPSVDTDTFTLVDNKATAIPGTINCNGNTAQFTPTTDLASDTYFAMLTSNIIDMNGDPLASDFQWHFATKPWWTKQWGSVASDYLTAVSSDKSGNVYATGCTWGDMDGTSNGGQDIFVTKFSAQGVEQWTSQFGSVLNNCAHGITIDSTGNIYLTGISHGDLDGQTANLRGDIFIAKYDPTGNRLWTRLLGTEQEDGAFAITVDSADNIYIAGYNGSAINGGNYTSDDLLVAKYDANGNLLWTYQWGTALRDQALGIATDGNDNVYVTGYTNTALDGQTTAGAGSADPFITKFNSAGTKLWTRQWGTSSSDVAHSIVIDTDNNVYVAGSTYGALDGQVATGINNADLFVTKFDASGNKLWTRQSGTTKSDQGQAIVADNLNNIYVSGFSFGPLDGQSLVGAKDIFVIKYNTSGTKRWTHQFGTATEDSGGAMTVDSNDNIFVAGSTQGSLDDNVSAGGYDAFIVKYNSDGIKQ